VCLTDVGHFSKTATSDVTKAARAKFESRRTNRLSRSTEALPTSSAEASASDIQSRRTSLRVNLFSSARHAAKSRPEADATEAAQQETVVGRRRRSKRRPQSQCQSVAVNVADDQSASSDTSRDVTADCQSTSSTQTLASATRRQPLTGLQSVSTDTSISESSAHRLSETSRSVTQEPRDTLRDALTDNRSASDVSVTRRYRAPAVTMPMPFSSTTGRNVQISDDSRTAWRQPGDFCNAYVFTNQPLLPGEELVVRITGRSMDYVGGLTVGLTACDPSTLKVADLPDDADKLLDRPEYWVIHKNICSHPKVNDELAFLRTVSGKLYFVVAKVKKSNFCLQLFENVLCVHYVYFMYMYL